MIIQQRPAARDGERGFTLIEMLVSIVIVAVLSFGLFRIFTSTNETYKRGTENIDGQQNARAALNWIAKELRGAKGFNQADANRVAFVSDQYTTNQIRAFQLDVDDQDGDGSTSELLLVRSPLDDGTPGVAMDEIAVGVDSLAFTYRGANGAVTTARAAVQEVEIFLFATGQAMRDGDVDESHGARQVGMSTRVRCRNLGKSVPTGGDVTPPADPAGLVVNMACGTASLSWTANAEDDIAGYYLHYSAGAGGSPYSGTGADQGASPIFVSGTSYTLTGLAQGSTYYFAVTSIDASDNGSSYSNEVSGTPADANAPVAPSNLTGRVVGNSEIQLSWTPAAEWDISYYEISWYDDVDAGVVNADSTQESTIILTGLNRNAVHYCSVAAVDNCGNRSPFSAEITITMVPCEEDVTFPEIPENFSTIAGDEFVKLVWDPVPDTDVVGYQVYFQDAGGGFSSTLLVGNVTQYSVYGLENGTPYDFQVAALDGCGHLGGYTGQLQATPEFCGDNVAPPSVPLNVAAWDVGLGDQIEVSWTASTDGDILGYKIYYGPDSGNYTNIYDAGDDINVTLTGLPASDDYFFVVTAYDVCGNESAKSDEASATATWGCVCPPTISTSTPANFAIVSGVVDWWVSADACSSLDVAKVVFEIDGSVRYVDYTAPYQFGDFGSGWSSQLETGGAHTLVATAIDENGCEAADTVAVYVDNSGLGVSCLGIESDALVQTVGTYNEQLQVEVTNLSAIDTYYVDAISLDWSDPTHFPYMIFIDGSLVWQWTTWPDFAPGDTVEFIAPHPVPADDVQIMDVYFWETDTDLVIDLAADSFSATFFGLPLEPCGPYEFRVGVPCDLGVTIAGVNSSNSYDVRRDPQIGDEYYTDRSYTITFVPDELQGATYIRTPNDDKTKGDSHALELSFPSDARVYIAYDPRGNPPDWIENEYVNSGVTLGVSDSGTPTLALWKKDFSAGTHTFSGNYAQGWGGGVATNYVIFIVCQ